jgi:hypothetical protein
MIVSGTTESGAEEWLCPDCGRRMVLRWPPDYDKLVLEVGDESAVHVGGKGGLRVGRAVITPGPAAQTPGDARGDEWRWLRDNGIEWGDESA